MVRDISEKKEQQAQLQQAQKMEAMGQLTGGIAHDFNNLLTTVIGNLDLQGDQIHDNEPARTFADAATRAALRGADLTQRLLAFSRNQPLNPRSINVNQLMSNATELLRRTLGEDIEVETVLGGGLWNAMMDQALLESTLLNLAINSRDSMPDGGKLTIETANVRLDREYAEAREEVFPGQYVMIAASDTGTGMPPEVLGKAFEPFFTTKEVGKGSGLGLSMVYGFIKQSGGHVAIYSELGQGTTVKLYLPRAKSTDARAQVPARPPKAMPTGDEIILIVEDDPDVRAFLVTSVATLGYNILEAEDGPAAVAVLDKTQRIDLLLTDVVLPRGMNGREVAEAARALHPEIKVLFTSGYTENAVIHHRKVDEGVELLSKPYTRQLLAQRLRQVLDAPKR
jgi:nitrogen-specific signal transduction histidine kinase/CheY-like chemotaxis protein